MEVLLLHADGRSEVRVLGRDLEAGMLPQQLVPGGAFHSARLRSPNEGFALPGTSV